MAKLTAKQELFCQEYIIDLNATQAAIRAGYSEKTARQTAARLLTKANISARVKELKDKRAEKLELDAYWVLKRLKEISDRSMQQEPVMQWDPNLGEMVETGEYQFDSNGANKATELIGKHIGMFDPKLKLQLEALQIKNDKTKKETEFIEERTKLIKGEKKDTSLLDVLIDAVTDDE
ncbi:terminase small subunit [Virgibacillus sp. AGTR]|uniref:terminase small subunit n=1 Tax=unclassified Virgibacillus TaxID=2620237 RepID=UPI000EF53891|nr:MULTISPECIES: terminase small subunit [unclassified Virgibacillus]MCC2250069.1 terminase small subunit [Virgibacillus sp. AGTR]QRZ17776.1 terminase small subunit [Virgibacillus sp. AGTR]